MHPYLLFALRIATGLGGMILVITTLSAAIRSFVLPRNEVVRLNVWVFMGFRVIFEAAAKTANSYERRDRIMAHYAPVALVALPVVWEALVSQPSRQAAVGGMPARSSSWATVASRRANAW